MKGKDLEKRQRRIGNERGTTANRRVTTLIRQRRGENRKFKTPAERGETDVDTRVETYVSESAR